MIFNSLKMAGFKSFADQAEVDIEAGLTGIVGPNGCGKSNVVEALRWVMGESSAKQIRGTELDDIIFSGTESRPQRNHAEISLKLDNSERRAPADFNADDELEITRRIERGKGSSYSINGRPARAKDVQLLFADTATGSRSTGIVSQGRIGAIVGAKPENRRSLLEEAANITGLHQRRHEAELRLKNAEINLERLDDIMTQMADQRQQLQRQARQTSRYRSVAERIRKAEATLFFAKWQEAQAAIATANIAASAHKLAVAEATQKASASSRGRIDTAEGLAPLREAEVRQAAELQRLKLTLGEAQREETRIAEELQRLQSQLQQIDADRVREITLQEDAAKSLAALQTEADSLSALHDTETPKLALADGALIIAKQASKQADEQAAEAQSKWQAFTKSKEVAQNRSEALKQRLRAAEDGLNQLQLSALEEAAKTASATTGAQDAKLAQAEAQMADADLRLQEGRIAREQAYQNFQTCQNQLARLNAEADALSNLLAGSDAEAGIPISDALSVSDNMEAALAACLADDLALPLDTGRGVDTGEQGYWRGDFKPYTDIKPPAIGTPLTNYVVGPKVLMSAISGFAVIDDPSAASLYQPQLKPGQALVSQTGSLWRWDGVVRQTQAGSQASNGERIRQRQRLDVLQADKTPLDDQHTECQRQLQLADEALSQLQKTTQAGQALLANLRNDAATSRRAADKSQLALQAAHLRAEDLKTAKNNALSDLQDIDAHSGAQENDAALEQTATKLAKTAEAARSALSDALQAEASLKQSLEAASRRLKSIADQQIAWDTRKEKTASRIIEVQTRQAQAETDLLTLKARPDELVSIKANLFSEVEAAQQARNQAGDALAGAETLLKQAETQQRADEQALASARESQIRSEAVLDRCSADIDMLRERITEKLEIKPDGLAELAGKTTEAEMEPLERLEERVARLLRERESLGPVNLRADVEVADIEARIASMEAEKQDLVAAIAKLRSAISTLNREGRARLLASFADVNKHFTQLFTSLFGGGHAELQLTDSDDPLKAGLEILASPPGKKMQSLSLLSGGEQALTALAIIFAVFLTNPAPICILDEVDAPLDDTNVAKFCDLLRDIVGRTRTRFLVVTHHRMTMARMDRLFGVTMEQRGISRLVSVDLQTAESMRDSKLV